MAKNMFVHIFPYSISLILFIYDGEVAQECEATAN